VTMSQKEFQRVKVIENAAGGRLSVREASRLLHLSERQVQRLKRRYRPDSVGWVQHGNRARAMPWAVSIPQKQLILTLARGAKPGFFRNAAARNENLETRSAWGGLFERTLSTSLGQRCGQSYPVQVLKNQLAVDSRARGGVRIQELMSGIEHLKLPPWLRAGVARAPPRA
jgi:transposase